MARDRKFEAINRIIATTGGVFDKDAIAKAYNAQHNDNVSDGYISIALKRLSDEGQLQLQIVGRRKLYSHDGIWENVDNGVATPITADPAPIYNESIPADDQFEMLEHFTQMVIQGQCPSCLIAGMPGVGKTYTIMKEFEEAGLKKDEDYIWVSGKASPMGLYQVLHNNRNGKIIFDDCDDVLKDPTSINILKAALDLYKIRTISWYSKAVRNEDLEESFEFSGQVIFICNIDLGRIHKALRSRAFRVNIQLTPEEVIARIRKIMPNIEPNGEQMAMELKQDALNAMLELSPRILSMGKGIDIRTFNKACMLRASVDKAGWEKTQKYILYQLHDD
jgi:hypothetical protein